VRQGINNGANDMTQTQVTKMVQDLINEGVAFVQALTTAMTFKKVADLKAEGYDCSQADIAVIVANARRLSASAR
jgi:hypothetical protein